MSVAVLPLRAWPEDRVRRGHRLLAGAVRQLTLDGAPEMEIVDAERDAALLGEELVRRGLL